jgi:hypothetical protein
MNIMFDSDEYDEWRLQQLRERSAEYIFEGYDAEGYDAEGYDADGFNRNGEDKYGNERISVDRLKILEAQYVPSVCVKCHEELSDAWKYYMNNDGDQDLSEGYGGTNIEHCENCLWEKESPQRKLP